MPQDKTRDVTRHGADNVVQVSRAEHSAESTAEPCEAKRRLLDDYQAATEAFSRGLTVLNDRIGTSSRDEYDRLRRAVDDARLKSEEARLVLERHVADHAC